MKKSALIIVPLTFILFCMAFSVREKPSADSEIKWMTWKEMQAAQKKQPRKVVIDVYTGWCGWCKKMDASTFVHPEVVKYVNENFYAVKFDAESRETIRFKDKDYKYVAQGNRGYNELAAEMLGGQMSYPTSVYLDEHLNQLFPVPGYMEARTFERVLNFVASNSYKSQKWDEFDKNFKGKID
ncbi:MAG: DUF255 domain-containing protein [Bacteroidetes bacterium]|nr:DUF255 domain-containing protein [Bacteroidota bacterium]